MDKKGLDKLLHENMSADMIAALDARYVRGGVDINTEKCETNPIIAKKQKIADFYKSLDNDEKFLIGMICLDPSDVVPDMGRAMRICSEQDNPCDDYNRLMDEKFKRVISHYSNFQVTPKGMGEGFPFHF